jgi:phospholipase C
MNSLVKHVVFIVKENHTFDNYFGTFPNPGGRADATLPKFSSSWPGVLNLHLQHSNWMKRVAQPGPNSKMQFTSAHIPAYFAYAQQFTLCDNYFSEVAGASKPNHLMLIAADTPFLEISANTVPPGAPFSLPSLPQALDAANLGYTWACYFRDPALPAGASFDSYFKLISYLAPKPQSNLMYTQFATDVQAKKLPTVSYLYAPHALSEHPAGPWDSPAERAPGVVGDVKKGSDWTAQQVQLLVDNGYWADTVIFIIWDDWGAWYDSVDPPPLLETWNGTINAPMKGEPFRYGPRVGCLVLGAYAKANYISHALHSHVSLLRFCVDQFDLTPWHDRVWYSDGMGDCFEFDKAAKGKPTYTP